MKESVWADERISRTGEGEIRLPKIIVRRPRRGDIHPLPKTVLSGALRRIPVVYLYGLTRIELRPRQGTQIGRPFGRYWSDEKAIILYSLPMRWVLHDMPRGLADDLELYRAKIMRRENTWHVRWTSEASIAVWYFHDVLTHELGHHFAEQYKKKRGRIRGRRFAELNAELHSFRLTRDMFNRLRRRRQEREETSAQED